MYSAMGRLESMDSQKPGGSSVIKAVKCLITHTKSWRVEELVRSSATTLFSSFAANFSKSLR